jgi:hypothetical protein
MTKPIYDKLSEQIDAGVRSAIREAIERHRRLGESITFSKDGKIITLTADKIPPLKPNSQLNKPS